MSRIDKAIEIAARGQVAKVRNIPDPPPREIEAKDPQIQMDSAPKLTPLPTESEYLVALHQPNGLVSEEYKKLLAQIQQASKQDSFQNTLLVTSSVAGEGKSLTASNLAISLARQLDNSVLLIDADLRRPWLHEIFGIPQSPGLVQCLLGEADLRESIVHTELGRLTLLPAGELSANPQELISSKQMKTFVEEIKQRYEDRYVLFDSPPVHSFADASIMGPLMDGVIYVVREKFAKIIEVREGLEQLKGSNVLGMVYNGAGNLKHSGYGYGYGYGY